MVRGKKPDVCNICNEEFPRRSSKNPNVEGRSDNPNEPDHRKVVGEKATINNYRKYLRYSDQK